MVSQNDVNYEGIALISIVGKLKTVVFFLLLVVKPISFAAQSFPMFPHCGFLILNSVQRYHMPNSLVVIRR